MKWSAFKTRVPGKWVLAGEHSVLRGGTAVALPHPELGLSLSFEPDQGNGLSVKPSEAAPVIYELLASIQDSWDSNGRSFFEPHGVLEINSTIPIGAGLGSSAALCVALTRWMSSPLGISEDAHSEFATQLEHRFHGRSSGMDVAVILAGEPISFAMERGPRSVGVKKLPKFTFHDTGLRSRTSECVLRIEKFREEYPSKAVQIDEAMGTASRLTMEGLVLFDAGNESQGLEMIQKGMNQARECFYSWSLVPGDAKRLEEQLLKQGARAVKLTGAGGGGVIVALWDN